MKDTIQELAAGDTATGTAGISSVQGEAWGREILDAAKDRMFFEQFARVVDVPQGIRDWHLPIASANLNMELTVAENTDRTMTLVDNLSTVDFTPSTRKLGVAVSRDVIRTSQVDILDYAREQLVFDAALNVDTDLATAIVGAAAPAATLFGGTAVSRATLAAGDVLTTDLIAEAQGELKQNSWMPEPDRPFVLFIGAVQEQILLQDAQFVDASQYGSDVIVMNGEIGRYIGVKVIVTENSAMVFADGGAGGNLNGHVCVLLKARVSYGLAWGERPFLDSEYWKLGAQFRLFLDMTYDAQTLQENAIVLIEVLDV